jgi:hypothetical protein
MFIHETTFGTSHESFFGVQQYRFMAVLCCSSSNAVHVYTCSYLKEVLEFNILIILSYLTY